MNSRIILGFILIGVLIGFFFTIQLRADVPVSSLFPTDQLEARDQLLKTFIDEQALLQNRSSELRSQIEEQQKNNEQIISRAKLSILEEQKEKIGLSVNKGPGITLLLDDSPGGKRELSVEGDESLVQAADLRDLVNFLRMSGATAISINQQRIIASTSISAVGASILVNNFHLTPPFVITAVADPDFIFQRFQESGILTDLKRRAQKLQMPLKLKREEQVVLPAFSGNIQFHFLKSQSL